MATKEELRKLIEQLPESEAHAAKRYLQYLIERGDPLLHALASAPEDDEHLTEEDRAVIDEGRADAREGRMLSTKELRESLEQRP